MDDILVFSKDQEEHNQRLRKVMERLQSGNVTLYQSTPTEARYAQIERRLWPLLGHAKNSRIISSVISLQLKLIISL